jgi:hypothetical protein
MQERRGGEFSIDNHILRKAEDLAHHQGPQQSLCWNLRLSVAVARILQIPPESQTPRHIVQRMAWRRTNS